jgi:hypothetical protein
MFTRIYKSFPLLQSLLVVLFGLILWAPRFFIDSQPLYPQTALFGGFAYIQNIPYLSVILSLLLLTFSALLIQRSLHHTRLHISGHFFPILIFIIIASVPHIIYCSPIIVALFILAVSMTILFSIPETVDNDRLIFETTFCFGVACIIYPPAVFLMLLFLFPPLTNQIFSKKTVIALLGFLFPLIWIFVIFYILPNEDLFPMLLANISFSISLPDMTTDIFGIVILALLLFNFALYIIRLLSKISERTAIIRRRITLSILLILVIIVSAFFSYDFFEHLSLLAIPMTAMMTYYYNEDAQFGWIDYLLMANTVLLFIYPYTRL